MVLPVRGIFSLLSLAVLFASATASFLLFSFSFLFSSGTFNGSPLGSITGLFGWVSLRGSLLPPPPDPPLPPPEPLDPLEPPPLLLLEETFVIIWYFADVPIRLAASVQFIFQLYSPLLNVFEKPCSAFAIIDVSIWSTEPSNIKEQLAIAESLALYAKSTLFESVFTVLFAGDIISIPGYSMSIENDT